ncbi:GNAT family N-acetyltransferase [Pseudarthrobacter sp. N5]|uniref:GNAT family N-acetyltransferase n=1 Tax=Pseudarthrobacter sp. N5 TaxID=3418416 RepID=UPI003CEDFF76
MHQARFSASSSPPDGNIWLRPLEPGDAAAHYGGEDSQLVRWYAGSPAPSLVHVSSYIGRVSQSWADGGPKFAFAICIRGGADLCGTLDVDLESAGAGPGHANVAYGLYPPWRGLATAAVVLVMPFLGQFPQLHEAVIRVHPDNPASACVARRSGFTVLEAGPEDGLLRFARPL